MRTQLQRTSRGRGRPTLGRRQPALRVRDDVRLAGYAGGGLLAAVAAGFLLGFLPALRRYLRMKRM